MLTAQAVVAQENEVETQTPSTKWYRYFKDKPDLGVNLPWSVGANLPEKERQMFEKSLQDFQLGESGEGRHFRVCARKYVEQTQDYDYLNALELFLREENHHSSELGRYLDLTKIAKIEDSPLDGIFSGLRHLGGLEVKLCVLLCAEIMGKIYYQSLEKQTSCRLLEQICHKFVQEEEFHLQFHLETFKLLRQNRSKPGLFMTQSIQKILLNTTFIMVWLKHKPAFKGLYPRFKDYWNFCQQAIPF